VTELGEALRAHDSALDELVLAGLSREHMHAMLEGVGVRSPVGRGLDQLGQATETRFPLSRSTGRRRGWIGRPPRRGADEALVRSKSTRWARPRPAAIRWLGPSRRPPSDRDRVGGDLRIRA
jgi:hypothetical protein